MEISNVQCNHTDITASMCQHTGSEITIDDVMCEADKACGCTKAPSLYVPPILSYSPETTNTLKVKKLSVRHERESLMHIDLLPEKSLITMTDTNYLLEPVGISNLIRIVNGSKLNSIIMRNIKCTHTDMNMLLSSLNQVSVDINSVECVPDDRCGCLLESEDILITYPNASLTRLDISHEGDILKHIQFNAVRNITLSNTDYMNSPARLEYVRPLLDKTGNSSLYIIGIKCTHTEMKLCLSSVKVFILTIDSLDCVPDDRCGCLKTESRTDSATIGTRTMTEGYSSSHEHIDLLSETSGQQGHVSEFHADYIVLRSNSNLPPHIVAKSVTGIEFLCGHYDSTNEHSLYDAIERCVARSVELDEVTLSPDIARNIIKYLNQMKQCHELEFKRVIFTTNSDMEIFADVIKQLSGQRYDVLDSSIRMSENTIPMLHCRIHFRRVSDPLPSWQEAKSQFEDRRANNYLNYKGVNGTPFLAGKKPNLSLRTDGRINYMNNKGRVYWNFIFESDIIFLYDAIEY